MSVLQIKVGGFGGQGVILAGVIIGKASAIHDNKHVTMTRSYGPEARGGACSAQIVTGDRPIDYPYVIHPDVLLALSQEACACYASDIADDGMLVYESDLVTPGDVAPTAKRHGIPCTRIAEELGSRVVMNMVMMGYFAKVSDAVSKEALQEAIRSTVPPKTTDINLLAFERGYEYQTD